MVLVLAVLQVVVVNALVFKITIGLLHQPAQFSPQCLHLFSQLSHLLHDHPNPGRLIPFVEA